MAWPVYPFGMLGLGKYSIEYLVIGGGGGAGGNGAGGGGAGGYRSSVIGETSGRNSSAEQILDLISGTSYTVTIGAGGASGFSGNNSIFGPITSFGGGYGAGSDTGGTGGSGGGGATRISVPGSFTTKAGGAGVSGQGFSGGTAFNYDNLMAIGGGGGGVGTVGSNTSGANGGNGGNGIASSINGTSTTRGGGGGGGAQFYPVSQGGCGCGSPGSGGSGGGGNAAPMTAGATGDNGTVNTGGGAGAGSGRAFESPGSGGGSGGSGVIIIRYLGSQKGQGGTVTSSGGYTIHTFTSSTTYVA